jgi:alkylated DNA repair dioxygenase AlkB
MHGAEMAESQRNLFPNEADSPAGFRYLPELIEPAEEHRLVKELAKLEFAPFEFHGFLGKRRVVSFGRRYDFNEGGLKGAEETPAFLLPVRERAARAFGREPPAFQQVLLTEYAAGAAIGWHKDRSVFGDVIGISLLSPCTFRFRKKAGAKWERRSIALEPRSAYLLTGPTRTEWEHSIPAVTELRYSITFRTLK